MPRQQVETQLPRVLMEKWWNITVSGSQRHVLSNMEVKWKSSWVGVFLILSSLLTCDWLCLGVALPEFIGFPCPRGSRHSVSCVPGGQSHAYVALFRVGLIASLALTVLRERSNLTTEEEPCSWNFYSSERKLFTLWFFGDIYDSSSFVKDLFNVVGSTWH